MGKAAGRIGGAFGGYSIECTREGNIFHGRLGGKVSGNDINLEISAEGNHLWGRVGGEVIGKDLNMALEPGRAFGRLGGETIGDDISLEGHEQISGRVGGSIVGFDCNLKFIAAEGRLQGRLGGTFVGADVNLDLVDFPPLVAAVLACVVYKIYLERSRAAKGGR
ncbi:hypothetical protein [Dethiobacter alkaliphilus]|uniref:hypothetical protein n=1 Tax=Dethiobacter alkaliphilus TaxID=427926 RepID=UPI00030C74B2|nr:hypothetical protein [Dethiobacter alkaliphilus]